jgi:RNA-dependent RNA polymerase
LGLTADSKWEGVDNWYGGRIQQVAHLDLVTSEPMLSGASPPKTRSLPKISLTKKHGSPVPFCIRLDKLESTRSCGFARFLGSRHLLQVRVPKKLLGDEARAYMQQKFVICGRVFVPFQAKENNVYMMETDENVDRVPDVQQGDQHRMSFSQFVEWFNPLSLNYKQVGL